MSTCLGLGPIVSAAMTRREARTALFKAGWTFAGGGSFASVWRSPCGTRVVKVTKPDQGAEQLYALTQRLTNESLPVYHGRQSLAGGGAAFEVEALEELDPTVRRGLYRAVHTASNLARCITVKPVTERIAKSQAGSQWGPLQIAMLALTEITRSNPENPVGFDLHEGNVMMRGETVVLTDPLYEMGQLTSAWSGSKHGAASVARDTDEKLLQPVYDEAA